MTYFDTIAVGFAAAGILNLFLAKNKGARALGLALSAGIFAVAAYLWEKTDSSLPKWLAAAAAGVFLATAMYESAKRKIEPK